MSSDHRYSYVREMRRNRTRRIAVARMCAARAAGHTGTEVAATADPEPAGQKHWTTQDIDNRRDISARYRAFIYLGRHSRSRRRAGRLAAALSNYVYPGLWAATVVLGTLLAGTSAAQAAGLETAADLPTDTLTPVINQLRLWLVVVLAAVATLFFVLGALRYLASNGDPGEIERAKSALKSSAIGYALALCAPLFIGVVTSLFPAQQ